MLYATDFDNLIPHERHLLRYRKGSVFEVKKAPPVFGSVIKVHAEFVFFVHLGKISQIHHSDVLLMNLHISGFLNDIVLVDGHVKFRSVRLDFDFILVLDEVALLERFILGEYPQNHVLGKYFVHFDDVAYCTGV